MKRAIHLSFLCLRRQVLQRDGWRCQHCGSMSELQLHHISFRSHLGDDREENLITISANCHGHLHGTPSSEDVRE